MVFYFTGTGNSLYAAMTIGAPLQSIPQVLRSGKLDFTAETIGIVAPVYGHEIPPMVKEFLRKARFHTPYFFMVLTYGNRHGGAAELAQQLCQDCGIQHSYINVLLMVDNWLPSFDMEEQMRLDKQVDAHLAQIAADIAARKHWIAPVSESDRAAHREFLARSAQMPAGAWQHLIQVSDRCIGCGICQRVCPTSSIKVRDGRAIPIPGNCQTCLFCVHNCPQMAIGLTIPEKNAKARYRNEHITLAQIIRANEQTDPSGSCESPDQTRPGTRPAGPTACSPLYPDEPVTRRPAACP